MKLAEWIDRGLEPFAPRLVRRRMAERMALTAMRGYDAAGTGRRSNGWKRSNTSADREGSKAQGKLRDVGYELVRNNPFAAAIDIQMTAHLVGDGIAPRAVHRVKAVQKRAQAELDAFFKSRVDGRHDMYGCQKLAVSAMVVGGDSVMVWGPDDDGPDGTCQVLEGAFLDHQKNVDTPGLNRIVQGVEFDATKGHRVAYWLHSRHPGDQGGYYGQSKRYLAQHVDHIFEARRAPQTRGVSWLAPVATTLREVADTGDAKLMKEKVAACLALVLTAPDGGAPASPFDETGTTGMGAGPGGEGRPIDTLRPGMVMRARAGETAHVVNPPTSGEGVSVMRQALMSVAAVTVPYHVLTGDPSQANYSSLRALTLPFWQRLDDIQQNVLVPHMCQPAAERRMARLALATGDRRYRDVTFTWSMPVRRFVDPIKDFAGELAEVRAGMKSMVKSLTERGLNPEEHVAEIIEWLKLTDAGSLAFDSDPRRVAGSGQLQAPAGYLYGGDPKKD